MSFAMPSRSFQTLRSGLGLAPVSGDYLPRSRRTTCPLVVLTVEDDLTGFSNIKLINRRQRALMILLPRHRGATSLSVYGGAAPILEHVAELCGGVSDATGGTRNVDERNPRGAALR